MARPEPLGLRRIEAIHYYVRDLPRSRRFYTGLLDFAEVGRSSPELTLTGRQESVAFQAGDITVVCSAPAGEGGRAARYLRKHPDGIGTVIFEVEDADRAFHLLDRRGGTPISEVMEFREGQGRYRTFSITTPFGDTTFRFVQRDGYARLYPGFEPTGARSANECGFGAIDHITSNFQTMSPALLWMEHVMGFERFWQVQFHTDDVAQVAADHGSGLRSVVMWDPVSGARFANNEPYRPHFKASQINVFNEDHRGDGVQHVAFTVEDILSTVRRLRARGVEFMPTPATYYELLPARLQRLGVNKIDEDLEVLRELQILVDGERDRSYMLQIFLKDSAGLYGTSEAGPFFYEIIQRKGDQGFGAGNFRALFESIERAQKAEGRA